MDRSALLAALARNIGADAQSPRLKTPQQLADLIDRTIRPRRITLLSLGADHHQIDVASGRIVSLDRKTVTHATQLTALDDCFMQEKCISYSVALLPHLPPDHQGVHWQPAAQNHREPAPLLPDLQDCATCFITYEGAIPTYAFGPSETVQILQRMKDQVVTNIEGTQFIALSLDAPSDSTLILCAAPDRMTLALVPNAHLFALSRAWQNAD